MHTYTCVCVYMHTHRKRSSGLNKKHLQVNENHKHLKRMVKNQNTISQKNTYKWSRKIQQIILIPQIIKYTLIQWALVKKKSSKQRCS